MKQSGQIVLISTVVLSEYLQGISDPEERKESCALLLKRFRVISFDSRSAIVAAELLASRESDPGSQIDRRCLKADAMIIASAIVFKTTRIVTNDKNLRKLAQGRIEVASIEEDLKRLEDEGRPRFDGGTGRMLDDVD